MTATTVETPVQSNKATYDNSDDLIASFANSMRRTDNLPLPPSIYFGGCAFGAAFCKYPFSYNQLSICTKCF